MPHPRTDHDRLQDTLRVDGNRLVTADGGAVYRALVLLPFEKPEHYQDPYVLGPDMIGFIQGADSHPPPTINRSRR